MGGYRPILKGKPVKNWKWQPQRVKAAVMTAENDMPQYRIAEAVGVTATTLANWQATPAFAERVREIEAELDAQIMQLAIASPRKRLEGYEDLKRRLLLIVEDREQVYSGEDDVIGGRSGLIVKQTKSVGYGKNSEIVTENAFDAALVRELRAIDEQAAKELGQWMTRTELTGANGGPIVISDIVVDRSSASSVEDEDEDDEDPDD